ncbi:MAG: pilus assembly protein PilM [Phycisphaerales bacterium JB063]
MGLFKAKPGVIGLDIGNRNIKAAQLIRHGGGWSAHALATFRRREPGQPISSAEAYGIADVLRRRGFQGNRVALSAPEDAVLSSVIDLPPDNAQVSRDRVVELEVARVHRLKPDTFSYCWSPLPKSANQAALGQALCWVLPYERISDGLSALEQAGLRPTGVEPKSAAVYRGCEAILSDPSRISAVGDFGSGAARLVLVHQGRIVHERALADWSGDAISSALAEKWSAPVPLAQRAMERYGVDHGGATGLLPSETSGTISGMLEEMIEQVTLSFSFVSHQYPEAELGPLLLTGGLGGMPGLAGELAGGLELQVVPITPAVLLSHCGEGRAAASTSLVSAIGLAMQEGGRHG